MKLKRKTSLLAAGLFAAMILTSGCGQVKVGYVDNERLAQAPQLKSVMEDGQKKMEEILQKADEDFKKKENATDEDFQKAQMELQQKLASLNQAYLTQLQQKRNAAVADVVKNKDLDVVMESSKMEPLVMKGGVDITDEVLQKLQ